MVCKNQCFKIKDVIPYKGGRKRVGHKSCITCEKAFPYEGLFCPCCGQRVRHKSRHQGRTEYVGVRY